MSFGAKFAFEAGSFVFWFIYCSYFEWFVHRYIMHEKHFPLHDAFRGHTIVHHQLYHWNGKFEATGPGRPPHVALRWYAFPSMIAFHTPFFWLIQHFLVPYSFWGALAACVTYFTGYEYTHYLMHVPKGHYVERFKWFRFIKEHHRLHHKYYLRNMNVFIPLADYHLGTLITSEGWRSKTLIHKQNLEKKKAKETKPANSEG